MRTLKLLPMLALAAACCGGCNMAAWPLYVFGEPATKTVPAEVPADLAGKTIALVVYAGPETQMDHQTVHLELPSIVGAEMRKRLKDVSLISPVRVLRYQDEHPDWNSTRIDRLCSAMNCDYIVLITVMEFATREPGSLHLARGRLTAEASVYAAKPVAGTAIQPGLPPSGQCIWRSDTFRILYPQETRVSLAGQSDDDIRAKTQRLFAEALVRKFYQHEVPLSREEAS